MSYPLIGFLTARLDEDEVLARRAIDDGTPEWTLDGSITAGHPTDEVVDWVYGDRSEHIARHDPARVLREVQAHRAMIEHLAPFERLDWSASYAVRDQARQVLYDMAAIWRDHPDNPMGSMSLAELHRPASGAPRVMPVTGPLPQVPEGG